MGKPRRTQVLEKRLHAGKTAPRQYLTGIDVLHGHVCVPLIFVYNRGFDLAVAERGLREVLQHYPQVSGRYKKDAEGQVYNDGQDHGIDFRVFRCEGPMPYGPHHPLGKDLKHFYKAFMPWQVVGKDQPLIQADVHQFDDGGIVLCVYMVHSTFDGTSFFGFMVNWGRACRGLPVAAPTFDRDVMIRAGQTGLDTTGFEMLRQPAILDGVVTMSRLGWRALGIRKAVFRIPAQAIQRWKDTAEAELPNAKGMNAGKLVTAYVLRALSPCMPTGAPRRVGMALDMRYVKGLSLPRDYFGNGLCYAQAHYTEDELARDSLSVLAERCKPPAQEVSAETVTQLLTVAEHHRQKKSIWRLIFKPAVDTLAGGIVQNNLSQLPIYDVDLGGGTPDWYETFAMTIRMMALVSTPQKDGGIDLHMAASAAELRALRERLAADGIAVQA